METAIGGIGVADHDAAAAVHHVDDGLWMDGEALSGRKDDRAVQKERKRKPRPKPETAAPEAAAPEETGEPAETPETETPEAPETPEIP